MKRRAGTVALALCGALAGMCLADEGSATLHAGRALYRGEQPLSQPARLQGVPLPDAACSACHGLRGEGRSEAGVQVPPVQWAALMQPRDALPAYGGEAALLRALTQGHGRQAQPLRAPMPRYVLSAAEQRALLAYWRVLGTEADPVRGVTATTVTVASVLPLRGAQARVGARIHAALAARFEAVNAAGGVFGRRIVLQALDGGATAAEGSQVARAAVQRGTVFALVGSLLPEPDAALRTLLRAQDVPMVATLGVPRGAAEPPPQLSYLLPSIGTQVRGLAAELARRCGQPPASVLVLHSPGAAWAELLAREVPGLALRGVEGDAPQALRDVDLRAQPVLALLAPAQLAQLRVGAAPACLGSLAVLSGTAPAGRTAGRELVGLPMPPQPEDPRAPGEALWATLADTAAQVFAEALARSGRELDAGRFARALDSLHGFAPAPGLSVGFSASQRHGFDMAFVWTEDPHALPDR